MANWWDSAPQVDPIDEAIKMEGLDPQREAIARSIYQQESGGGRNTTTSNAGAVGGMQIIPATFERMADKGWDINNPLDNARAGVRYVSHLYDLAGGDPKLTAAGYYGGEGAIGKARQGIAVSDPRNPNAPDTLQYADQVAGRVTAAPKKTSGNWWDSAPIVDEATTASILPAPEAVPTRPSVPTTEQSIAASAPMRFIKGAKDIVDGGAQMLAHAAPARVVDAVNSGAQYLNSLPIVGPVTKAVGLTPATPQQLDQSIARDEKAYQVARTATGQSGIDAYRLAGNIAATAPLMAEAPAAAASLPARIALGSAGGAGAGLLSPVLDGDYNTEKMKQAALGAGLGAAGSAVGGLLGRAIAPKAASNAQVQLLMNEGVTPTPGQLMGGVARTIEDKAMSVPILGDAIRGARTRGVEDYNRAALNRAVAPLGQKVNNIGREGMQEVDQIIGDAYDTLLPKLSFRVDPQFGRELGKLQQMAASLPDKGRQFNDIVASQVGSRLNNGYTDGLGFKQIESEIGRLASNYRSSAVAGERDLGNALGELQTSLRAALQRANPKDAPQLAKINKAYAQFTRLQRAAASTGADDGVFTPAQFSSAVRAADKSARKNAYAKGSAMMQDLSDAGRSLMNSKIPNSGTADRAFLGAGALGTGLYNPVIPAGLLAGAVPYLPGVSRAVAAGMARRPDAAIRAGGLLEQYSPVIGGLLGFGVNEQ